VRNFPDRSSLHDNPLNLIEGDLAVAAIVELGRSRALMRGHLLSVFEQPSVQ
jgi:hypothetical protein